ncbi:MAG TPA: glycosyltransferase family 4 protein, partial [Saprospiraceae bacterium]|nr:glycosyltransferase family 4 protein [Saprospiraceae bacterium]
MKVLMFGWEFPPHISGGLGTASYGLTKGLFKHGVEILFVVPKAFGDEDQSALRIVNASDIRLPFEDKEFLQFMNQIEYIEIGSNIIPYVNPELFNKEVPETETAEEIRSKVFSSYYQFAGGYGKNLMEEVSRYALIASMLGKQKDFDLIHAHDWLCYPAGVAAKHQSGKPLVVHMHATEFDRSGENINTEVFAIEKFGMENADRVIAVSNMTRDIVIEKYGIHPDKVVTVHNAVDFPPGMDTSDIRKNFGEKLVTFLGRITFQKGPDYFVDVAYKLLQKDPNIRFVMAGSGDMMEKVIKMAASKGITDKFHFTGFLKGPEIRKLFAISDVFVMPSISEPFGIVPLEAMQSNVPVVISKQSGVSEILTHAIK